MLKIPQPPWNSLVEDDDVADAISFISASTTDIPLPDASRAIPQPFTPPPMTKMSYDLFASSELFGKSGIEIFFLHYPSPKLNSGSGNVNYGSLVNIT